MNNRPANTQAELLDAEGRIQTDLPCIKCEYNLRSLHADGKCPECGGAVRESLRGDHLWYANPRWVRGMANGALALKSATVLTIVCLLTCAAAFALNATGSKAMETVGAMLSIPAMIVLLVTVPIALLVGVLDLTLSESKAARLSEGASARRVFRYALLWVIGLSVLALVAAFTTPVAPPRWVLRWALPAAAILGASVLLVSFFQHIAALARRVRKRRLMNNSRAISWGVFLTAGFLVGSIVAGSLSASWGEPVRVMLLWLGAALGVVLAIATAVVSFDLKQALQNAAEEAANNAARPGELLVDRLIPPAR